MTYTRLLFGLASAYVLKVTYIILHICMTITAIPIATVVEHYATKLLFRLFLSAIRKKHEFVDERRRAYCSSLDANNYYSLN